MTTKEALKQIEVLKEAYKNARSPEEAMSISFKINRLEQAKLESI